jgi:hypothetical protein
VIVTSAGLTVRQAYDQTGPVWTLRAQYVLEYDDDGRGWVEGYHSDAFVATTARDNAIQIPGVRMEVTNTKVADYRVVAVLQWVDPDGTIVSQAWVTPDAEGETACVNGSPTFDCTASEDRVTF